MTLESLEKLREFARITEIMDVRPSLYDLADAIQAEVDEYYMLLPVDADGVPIHPDDVIEWCDWDEPKKIETISYGGNSQWWLFADDGGECDCVMNTHHAKPRTVEDVLREFAYKVCDLNVSDEAIAKYAAELRLKEDGDD